MKEDLVRRSGRWSHRFYLYFEVDRATGKIAIETSWLPDLPEVLAALTPLGFQRADDGTCRVELDDAADVVGVLRRATKAITLLIGEATL